jgi:hypothetical protein
VRASAQVLEHRAPRRVGERPERVRRIGNHTVTYNTRRHGASSRSGRG